MKRLRRYLPLVSSFAILRQAVQLIYVDGESFDFTSFHVEVLPRAARVLSLEGRFHVSEFLKKHDTKG